MIVGFSKHGTGNGTGPTRYMTDPNRAGREDAPPEVVKGNADQTRELIDSLDFKHKYTSGVLSFEHSEKITPEMEKHIINRFEKMAFAGLESEQYNILWVRHTHAKHHELHFVTPRVEMESGKSMNIKPPGDLAQKQFDDFRSEVNARYGLADPDDPDRAKTVSTPDHELKKAAQALRSGQKPSENIRELIDTVMTQRAEQGLLNSREDVVENLHDLGFKTPREGKNYITAHDPDSGERWRLKGGLYAKDYDFSRTVEKATQPRTRDYSRPDPRAAAKFAERVDKHIQQRAGYNQKRYPSHDQSPQLEKAQEPHARTVDGRLEPLRGFVGRQLGANAIHEQPNNAPDRERGETGRAGGQGGHSDVRERQKAVRSDRPERGAVRGRVYDNQGDLKHDGFREKVSRSIQKSIYRTREVFERVRAKIGQFNDSCRTLANASDQLVTNSRGVEQKVNEQVKQKAVNKGIER